MIVNVSYSERVPDCNIASKQQSMTSQPVPSTPTKIRLCHTDDIAEGSVVKMEHGDLVLAVYNVDGEFFVTDDACTHGPGSLSEGELYGDVIECNFHGGQFNVRTGEVVGPPCMVPIKTYNVSIDEGHILIEV
jgi:nitrite reductase/ring-hydroxylating ferredoxin subunit